MLPKEDLFSGVPIPLSFIPIPARRLRPLWRGEVWPDRGLNIAPPVTGPETAGEEALGPPIPGLDKGGEEEG